MVDKLLLNFGAKFQQLFIISHVKLQNCHDNLPYASVPRWWQSFKNVRNEDVRALKDALENLNTRKSTSRAILSGILPQKSETHELKQISRSIII